MASDDVVAKLIQSRREGRKGCITCAKRICHLLVVRMSLLELNRATPVFRCSYSMGSPVRDRVRTGTRMTRSSSFVKAGEIHSFKAVGDSPLVQLDVHLNPRFIQENL
jgi:hypothetical protein